MKKILISMIAILLAVGLVGGGAFAYFNDTETSTGNTFTAGTLNLQVGSSDPCTVHIANDNIAPGDPDSHHYRGLWDIANTGTIAGNLSFEVANLVNWENGCVEPELNDPLNPDNTCGLQEGELGQHLNVTVVVTDPDGIPKKVWPVGINVKTLNETAAAGKIIIAPDPGLLEGGEAGTFHFKVVPLPSSTGNIVQSDSVEFDIIFKLEQVP